MEISGTYSEGGIVGGTKAKFCGQTSKFTIDDLRRSQGVQR